MIVEGNQENFDEEVMGHQGVVLLDFYADWCGPCKMVMPVLEDIAESGEVKVVKINVDEAPEMVAEYNVRGVPTFRLVRDGELLEAIASGGQTKTTLTEFIDNNL